MTLDPKIVAAAQAAMTKWRVPASVTLAQFALESSWGTRMPPGSCNPFGIKALAGQPFVSAMTREVIDGVSHILPQRFRLFADFAEAFDAHARLLATALVYAPAMAALPNVVRFVGLMAQHYATDPAYAAKLLQLIHEDGLTRYDIVAATRAAPSGESAP